MLTLNGDYVIMRLGRGQHLPNLGESFHELPVVLTPGKPVELVLDYMNTIYFVDPKRPIPDIDGFTIFLYLIPIQIAVDANRDGHIVLTGDSKDTTSQAKPFRFWINDDDDGTPDDEREVVPPRTKDYQDARIQTMRDLEDFSRLHLSVNGLHDRIADGTFKIGLKFTNATGGSAKINVYKCQDPEGSPSYLTEQAVALAQISGAGARRLGEVTSDSPLVLPADFWKDAEQNSPKCLLFEGSAEGKAKLVLTIHKADGVQVAEAADCWLELTQIQTMYQRHDGTGKNHWTPSAFETDHSEEPNAIVFVHGWRMSPDSASNQPMISR
jgi:hypothetical protein